MDGAGTQTSFMVVSSKSKHVRLAVLITMEVTMDLVILIVKVIILVIEIWAYLKSLMY